MSENIVTDHPFTIEQRATLEILVGLIVPADEEFNVPGADDPSIFAEIVELAITNAEQILAAVHFAQAMAADEELGAVADQLEGHKVMAPLVSAVMQCYYRDDRVMRSLGKEPRAPFPEGYAVESGDWSMLAPVQERGKIWRDA